MNNVISYQEVPSNRRSLEETEEYKNVLVERGTYILAGAILLGCWMISRSGKKFSRHQDGRRSISNMQNRTSSYLRSCYTPGHR